MSARRSGFALLELLVALAIFAVVSAIAYGALASVVGAREGIERASARTREIQLAVAALERDLRQATARPVRGNAGEQLPALAGSSTTLELTHAQFARPQAEARAQLSRTGYAAPSGVLQRSAYVVLDRAPSTRPLLRELAGSVSSARFRYLDHAGNWRESWPPRDGPERDPADLPRAVEFRIAFDDWGEVARLIELADGPAPAGAAP